MLSKVLITGGLGFLDLIYASGLTDRLSEILLDGSLPLRNFEI